MRVKWLKLNNFRNYDELVVEFFDGINLIVGKNGQGKTNMVEAVMLGALTKSPRTSHDEDMKKEGTDATVAEICVERSFGDLYKGMDVNATLELLEAIKNGESWEQVKGRFEAQNHSGMSAGLVGSMVEKFSEIDGAFDYLVKNGAEPTEIGEEHTHTDH